ncbi:hypothetical protein IVB45_17595 [Bradyrhizobium sp. 4]|uniref:hypothetical protein n=1 Tax=unclassified Bradyrhizobium TaxID=2631580 RepID=UPI001FF96AD0|nr:MULTISPECIES: hypothetical protein [unclassified Bradyrhizobium]MCK1402010.1 hypothetical protein [Bradyrhizobium sp. 39]MCK1751270.1 hypothetical protein [Bradyrhizobium sp. 135]UPJ38521.1 hypothetical protein IVB45_17595 [Bradyrhizobium sp. 4]
MRSLTSVKPPTQLERIAALEERDRAREEREQQREARLESIETKLGELVDLLRGAKTIKALIDGGFKYVGYAASIGAAGVGIWKFWH